MCAARARDSAPEPAPARFAALHNRDCRPYLAGTMLAMMADNVEHVITYWVLWRTFHSAPLAGFAVISHWVPFLLFSVYFGGLADRYDCRRVIQAAQVLFMTVSAAWGILFLTGTLQVWHACALLVLHGMAGALWAPAEQLMLHDLVGREDLPSAVRLNATARSLGILCGPVVGSVLLLVVGATAGMFVNIAFYLPLTLWLARTRFTGHLRDDDISRQRLTLAGAWHVLGTVRDDSILLSMIILGGLSSFFVGASVQSAMPELADGLGHGDSGLSYGVLLFATGAGGVLGGILLEATGTVPSSARSAILSSAVYGACMVVVAATRSYPLAIVMLFFAGVANLATMSIAQTLVQLRAPAEQRGAVVGVYGMSSGGLRAGSGFTVGLLGGLIGLHWSLGLSAAALTFATGLVFLYSLVDSAPRVPSRT